jgi:fatty-acyl-CoA synthase
MDDAVFHPSAHARTRPDRAAYVMAGSGEALTHRELDERSNRGARLFRSMGLLHGDHVAILMENCLPFMEVCWAAQRCGLYYTAISRYLAADEARYVVADCGARVLVVSAGIAASLGAQALQALAGSAQVLVAGGSWEEAASAQPATPVEDEVAGFDMLYSSGTTGRPKGVKRPLERRAIGELLPLMKALAKDLLGMGPDTVYLSPAPLYHAAPLRFSMAAAALGGTAVLMERFDAETFLRLVERHRVTHTQLVPTMFVRLLKLPAEMRARCDLSSLRHAVHAAAPCPPDVKQAMIDWWGPILTEYYAGTEGNGLTLATCAEWQAHRGTVGRAVVGAVKIVDDATGEVLPAGAVGGVWFAGGPRFEYNNSPEKTAAAHDARGWSTLGDVGYLDDDGFLHLTDRKAYMIISGGVNIYPQETEDVLVGHPAVLDAAVFGVPDEEMGEQVKAVIQPVDMTHAGPDLEAKLIAFCRERLSPIKCPRSVDFETELPRTPTGKLIKRHLRDRYWPNAERRV